MKRPLRDFSMHEAFAAMRRAGWTYGALGYWTHERYPNKAVCWNDGRYRSRIAAMMKWLAEQDEQEGGALMDRLKRVTEILAELQAYFDDHADGERDTTSAHETANAEARLAESVRELRALVDPTRSGGYVQFGRESAWGTPVAAGAAAPVVGVQCAKCEGHGWVEGGHDIVPYGSTTARMPIAEPCDALPEGVCHECGRSGEDLNDQQRCAACGEGAS